MSVGRIVFGPVPAPPQPDRQHELRGVVLQAANVHACNCMGPQPGQTKCPCALRAELQRAKQMLREGVEIEGRKYRLVPEEGP